MVRLADVIEALDSWYDPRWAEPWDAVGLVCGELEAEIEAILLAVDAVPDTVAEAIDAQANLLLTHHPLLLEAVHAVPADEPKGRLIHQMIRNGIAHFVAHTNADVADPGVSDALAERLGLTQLHPLQPQPEVAPDKLVVYVPVAATGVVIDALSAAGAGVIGRYERCAWSTEGTGTFTPGPGARPAIGEPGQVEQVAETRLEMVVPASRRGQVIGALRAVHPYEEPAFDLLAQVPAPSRRGTGRIGTLEQPRSLAQFVGHVADMLPGTVWGVRAAGAPQRIVRTVAVCGGSGASLAAAARAAGADAYVTADLKHHGAIEAVTERGGDAMALVDAAHWATEAPWLDVAAARLRHRFGDTVRVQVSCRVTDPWTLHCPSAEASQKAP